LSTDAGSVRVNIFNQTYSLRSASGDGEQVERVARLVDERMRTIASGLAVHDVAKVAVLTALNLADELEGLRSFYETELRDMITRAREEEEEQDETAARASEASDASEADDEPEPTAVDSATSTREPAPAEPTQNGPTQNGPTPDEPSWFDAIFDTDAPPSRAGEERLSSQVTSRLRSQVSARLRRLRQPSHGNSITEGGTEE
jgi:cell division protein ZapA